MKKLYWTVKRIPNSNKIEEKTTSNSNILDNEKCRKEMSHLAAILDAQNSYALKMAANTYIRQSSNIELADDYQGYKKRLEESLNEKNFDKSEISQAINIIISAISNEETSNLEASRITISGSDGHTRKISNLKFISISKILVHLGKIAFFGYRLITNDYVSAAATLISESISLANDTKIQLSEIETKIIIMLNDNSDHYCSQEEIKSRFTNDGLSEEFILTGLEKLVKYNCISKYKDGFKLTEKVYIQDNEMI